MRTTSPRPRVYGPSDGNGPSDATSNEIPSAPSEEEGDPALDETPGDCAGEDAAYEVYEKPPRSPSVCASARLAPQPAMLLCTPMINATTAITRSTRAYRMISPLPLVTVPVSTDNMTPFPSDTLMIMATDLNLVDGLTKLLKERNVPCIVNAPTTPIPRWLSDLTGPLPPHDRLGGHPNPLGGLCDRQPIFHPTASFRRCLPTHYTNPSWPVRYCPGTSGTSISGATNVSSKTTSILKN